MSEDRKSEYQYPDPEWFAEQLHDMKRRMDAMIKLARSHDVELKDVYPSRKTRLTLKEASYRTLKQAGHPLHLNDIMASVAEMGAPAGGRRPANTLHATLSQDPRVALVGVNVWGLVEWGEQPGAGESSETAAISAVPKKPREPRGGKSAKQPTPEEN